MVTKLQIIIYVLCLKKKKRDLNSIKYFYQ